MLADSCFMPLCQNCKPCRPRRFIESFSAWPALEFWNRSTAAMSLNMKGRSKMRNFLVNFSNFDSDGAASWTSPCSIASSTLLSS